MSRVLLFNIPAHGHTNPTLPLVKELVRRGERVAYYSSDSFRNVIEDAGAEFRSYRSGVRFDSQGIDKNIFVNAGMVLEFARLLLPGILEDLERRGEAKPDYVIHDSMCVWGKFIARILAVPAVTSVTMFAFGTRPALASFTFVRSLVKMFLGGFSGVARWLKAARDIHRQYRLNTFDLKDVFTNREPLNIVYTSRLFQPSADAFDERFRFVGPLVAPHRETFDLPLDEADDRPVVYVSLGTIVNEAERFYKMCMAALGPEPVRVVMSVGGRTDIPSLGAMPGNFIVRGRVPQVEVLRRASAFLTHAGMNSVAESLLARVPLVLFPQTAEQAMVARQVEHLGAGVRLHTVGLTRERIRDAVREVLGNPSYREGAGRIAESFESAGGCERAADDIFAFKKARGIR